MLSLVALSASIMAVNAAPTFQDVSNFTNGFISPIIVPSVGGHATCIQGNIPVQATAMNTELKYSSPTNQSEVTETIVEFLQVNATLPQMVMGGKKAISGKYNINSKLCFPNNAAPNASLILTHGVGFDKSYWDFFSAEYSYADHAALAGYTTFFYDRLGVGLSDHPDPIQVVQAPLEVSIAHELVQQLRNGSIASTKFAKVVGVGHSLGSELTNNVTATYPKDFDAAVLTGFSVDTQGQANFFSGLNLAIANQNQPARYWDLPNAYLVSDTIISNQFGFYRFPNFDPLVLAASEATKGTFTIGELFTNTQFQAPAPGFTGPIDVVDGQFDLPFCQSNCLVPSNTAAAVKAALYPNAAAGSSYFIGNGSGHGLNLHYVAPDAYQHIFNFLASNGL